MAVVTCFNALAVVDAALPFISAVTRSGNSARRTLSLNILV